MVAIRCALGSRLAHCLAMAKPLPPADNDAIVTTSDFVRHFGRWQERAAKEPVYILHRGRPRFVMTSVETMQQLCADRGQMLRAIAPGDESALLDLISDILLILDRDLLILQSSAAARRYFSFAPQPGIPMARLLEAGGQAMLDPVLRRVLATGLGETVEIAGPYPARQLAFSILPHPLGVAAVARDVTVIDDLNIARAQHGAAGAALAAIGDVATARLNLRGYVDAMSSGVAAMTGVAESMLIGVRFTSLIAREWRVAVADTIETALGGGKPLAIDAMMLIGGQAERPVRIGMAPIRVSRPVEGVALAIVGRAALIEA